LNIKKILLETENLLKAGIKHTPFKDNWSDNFPNHGGVYVLWKGEFPVYVGETSGIRSRMTDLMRPVNHAFTKKISAKSKITDLDLLRKHIKENYKLSYIKVELGRSEIEEYLIIRWRSTLINKPTKRLLEGSQYSWVSPI